MWPNDGCPMIDAPVPFCMRLHQLEHSWKRKGDHFTAFLARTQSLKFKRTIVLPSWQCYLRQISISLLTNPAIRGESWDRFEYFGITLSLDVFLYSICILITTNKSPQDAKDCLWKNQRYGIIKNNAASEEFHLNNIYLLISICLYLFISDHIVSYCTFNTRIMRVKNITFS